MRPLCRRRRIYSKQKQVKTSEQTTELMTMNIKDVKRMECDIHTTNDQSISVWVNYETRTVLNWYESHRIDACITRVCLCVVCAAVAIAKKDRETAWNTVSAIWKVQQHLAGNDTYTWFNQFVIGPTKISSYYLSFDVIR